MPSSIVGGTTQVVTDSEAFAAALKRMGGNIRKEFLASNRAIGKLVIARAKGKASTRQQAAAARTMSATAVRGGVGIRLSGPFSLGAEYGAKKYPQFPPWRGNQFGDGQGGTTGVGYFMHPAIRESQAQVLALYMQNVDNAARRAGIRTGGAPRVAGVLDIARPAA